MKKGHLPIPNKPVNGCIITVKNPAVLYHHTQRLVYKKISAFHKCKQLSRIFQAIILLHTIQLYVLVAYTITFMQYELLKWIFF